MMDESAADVEHQLLLPTANKSSGQECKACSGSPPTTARTLALVVLTAGLAFAVQLAAGEEYVLLAVFAAQFLGFCLFLSPVALCAVRTSRGASQRAGMVAVRVVMWSFSMALVMCMAFWVAASAPVAAATALSGLAFAVVFACFAEFVHSLWPISP